MYSNVNVGEGSSTSAIDNTIVPPSPSSSPPQTSTIPPTSVPTISPTFQGVMNDPITYLFSSQSVDQDQPFNEDDVVERVGFAELEFDLKDNNVYENAIMSAKRYKILNSKLKSIH